MLLNQYRLPSFNLDRHIYSVLLNFQQTAVTQLYFTGLFFGHSQHTFA